MKGLINFFSDGLCMVMHRKFRIFYVFSVHINEYK